MITRWAAAAAMLAAAPVASPAPSLHLTSDGAVVRAFLGEGGEAGPVSDTVLVRDASGRWSCASALPVRAAGIPVAHLRATWLLEARETPQPPFYSLLPLDGEIGTTGVRIESAEGAQDVVASALDPWTILLAELDVNGRLLVRTIASQGPGLEMSTERQETWDPGWDASTRLLTGGLAGEALVVVGVTASGQAVLSAFDGAPRALPALDCGEGAQVAACVPSFGPFVACVAGGSLVAHRWDGAAWLTGDAAPLPGSAAPQAIAACTVGARRTKALVALRVPGELWARSLEAGAAGGWERPSCAAPVDTAVRPPAGEKPLVIAARRQDRLRFARWSLAIAGCAALALLLQRLARIGRRPR